MFSSLLVASHSSESPSYAVEEAWDTLASSWMAVLFLELRPEPADFSWNMGALLASAGSVGGR